MPHSEQVIHQVVTEAAHDHGLALAWGIDWAGDLPVWLLIGALAIWYIRSVRAIGRQHASYPWPQRFTACFAVGLALMALVTTGPIAQAAMSVFSIHMVQHIVLMMLATPLIVMGAPVLLALRTTSPVRRRRFIVPVLRSWPFAFLTSPVVSWLVFAGVLVGVHFTPWMSVLMDVGPIGRYAEYALYVAAAFLYYYALLPGNPATNRLSPAARVFSLFLMMIPETMTGFFIYSAGFVLFPYFAQVALASGADGIADQQLGGALMWSTSMIIDVAWIAVAVHEWFGSEAVKTRRLDAEIAREGATSREGDR